MPAVETAITVDTARGRARLDQWTSVWPRPYKGQAVISWQRPPEPWKRRPWGPEVTGAGAAGEPEAPRHAHPVRLGPPRAPSGITYGWGNVRASSQGTRPKNSPLGPWQTASDAVFM
jgi:hypothetical protein